MPDEKPKPGPDPGRLIIEGDWEKAVGKALKKKRPAGDWPKKAKKKPADGESAKD